MTIFWDLDGPLLDVSARHHRVYADIVASLGFEPVSLSAYWQAKREKVADRDILARSGAAGSIERFRRAWAEQIEAPEALLLDRVQEGAVEALTRLGERHRHVLVTLRKSRAGLETELSRLGLDRHFERVLSSHLETDPRHRVKVDLVDGAFPEARGGAHVFIGDTETDILAGRDLGFVTVGVANGIRTEERLQQVGPTYLLRSIAAISMIEARL